MPTPFSPVHIPFISGVRQDLGKIAQDNPAQLRQAQNVMFTKKGHITGRPGLVAREAQTQVGAGTALVGSLTAAVGTATPSGIVATGYQALNSSDIDTPLACWQGQSYFNRSGTWEFAGTHWSLRQTKSTVLAVRDPGFIGPTGPTDPKIPVGGVAVGKDIVGVFTEMGTTSGFPFLNSSGEIKYLATGVNGAGASNIAGISTTGRAAANNALFGVLGVGGTAGVWGLFPTGGINGNGPGTGPEVQLQSALAPQAGPGLGACTDGTSYYVAFPCGAPGPGTSNVLKVDAAGVVLQTLSLTWAAGDMKQARSQDICYDPASNRLGVVSVSLTTGKVASKIITLVAGVMADAGIEVQHAAGPTISDVDSVFCGVTHNGQMSVLFAQPATTWTTGAVATKSGTVVVAGRAFTSTTATATTILTGAINASFYGQTWWPMFGAKVVAGRTLLGIFHSYEGSNVSSQWVIMDFTNLYGSAATAERTVVACGPVFDCERWTPAGAYSDGTRLHFAVSEGLTFTENFAALLGLKVPTISRSGVRRITLEPQGVQAAHVPNTTLLSGQLMHVFDGNKIKPDHFPEETPYIFDVNTGTLTTTGYGIAGGSLVAGSYSYQATWESINARGQVVRSGASQILTANGVTVTQKVVLQITKPQLWNNYGPGEYVRVRLWATQTNPTNNAPKYLVGEVVTSTPQTGFSETITHSTVATGTEEQLYETVSTLADMRAPGADRGIAVVNERAWLADQDHLYVSKLMKPGIAVSWNTEDTNVLSLPATLGTIQGLAAINQGLVVLCSRGAAVVTGPGVDDTGAGPGWTLQIIDGVPGMGNSSPRSLTATPAGVAFQAQDGDVWMANSNGQALPMSRAVRNNATANSATPIDVVNLTPTPLTNAMLVAHGAGGVLRVLDLETGQWGTWTFPAVTPTNGLFLASINGALWIQATAPGVVYSVDDPASTTDAGLGAITATIETGVLRQANPTPHGWGRLRSVILNEVRGSADAQVSVVMQVLADQNDRVLMNKTLTTAPMDTATFPGGSDGALEFGTTVQRCSYVRVLMTVTPATFNAEGLDLWVANTGEKSPSNNRG